MDPPSSGVDRPGVGCASTGTGVIEQDLCRTWDELSADAFGLRARVPRDGVATVVGRRALTVTAALLALEGWASRVHLVGDARDVQASEAAVIVDDAFEEISPATGLPDLNAARTTWVLYTSGTTGAPQPVEHTMASLTRTVRTAPRGAPARWGLLYDPVRLAGLQVILHAWANRCSLVDARVEGQMPARVDVLLRHGVDALSATPTMWRQVLQVEGADRLPLQQITLGGEIADQTVLDALRRTYPAARITHVFASTETGAAFSVSDGRAGFPADYLTSAPHGIKLDVRDGVLHVLSPGVSTAGSDGFASTGDLVEVTEDRVHFLGRASGVVNVGGVKVWPEKVERLLRTHEDVVDAVVTAKRSALTGSLLVATVVPAHGSDRQRLPAVLRTFCRGRLHPAEVPAVVTVAGALRTSDAGKALRS